MGTTVGRPSVGSKSVVWSPPQTTWWPMPWLPVYPERTKSRRSTPSVRLENTESLSCCHRTG